MQEMKILINNSSTRVKTNPVYCFDCGVKELFLIKIETLPDRTEYTYKCYSCGTVCIVAHNSLTQVLLDDICQDCDYKDTHCNRDIDPPVDDPYIPCQIEETGQCPECGTELNYVNHSEREIILKCTSSHCTEVVYGLPLTEKFKERYI